MNGGDYMRKTIILSGLALAIVAAGMFGVSRVAAQGSNNSSTLVQKIAEKFNLKTADVQAVFDQNRQEHHEQMETRYLEQLDQYVKDGKITEAQKQLIITKHKEIVNQMQTTIATLQDKTPEERRAAFQQQRTDLESWATKNGIDSQYIFGGFGMKHGGMRGMHP